ncbi:MAG: recombination-associated protein RdgC [Deltaproteobacteria bacterium]|nr:recombination-associated protein RdgC [Deltaproteobacteria bacterium]
MGFLSASVAVTRYAVNGEIAEPFMETVAKGLSANVIQEINGDPQKRSVGWAPFDKPYTPDFSAASFVVADTVVFCLRIDKKSLPAGTVKKMYAAEVDRRLRESGREFLSKDEKKEVKEHVENVLLIRMPSVPAVYDVLWKYGEQRLYFFSTQKAAKDELETLFYKSFGAPLIPLFPFTTAETSCGLTDAQIDSLAQAAPSTFATE